MSDLFFSKSYSEYFILKSIFIQKVSLEPSEIYTVVELNTFNQAENMNVHLEQYILQSTEVCQYYISPSAQAGIFQRHLF